MVARARCLTRRDVTPGRCFWLADRTTLVMNVPFTAVQFVVYESGKRALVASHLLDSTDEEVRACVTK